ncbi:MAG: carboxyl-terminal processing protease [Solirubrobacterales bacterium]|nr:carboxyl-terminal processing protease [Solirubrobacterales bacterium]
MRGARIAALVAALIVVLCAGIWLGGHPAKLPEFLRDRFVDDAAGLNLEATELIEDNYYRPVGPAELTNASLQGMVRELRRHQGDRFSDYFSPEALASFDATISGHFSGIGLTVSQVKLGLRVDSVFPHSPAQRAGIEPGDLIVSVDGESIAGESSQVSTAKIKGPEGSDVTIGVKKGADGKVREVEVTREQISLPVVSSKVKEVGSRTLGYVRLISFSEGAHVALREAVEKVEEKGAEGIVLDLRGNGGGLLEEAVLTASVFLPKDEVVVTTDSRTQGHTVYKTVGDNLPAVPAVVLIDRNTASAAEILTAALADDAGARVIGTRSYGKGVFQQEIGLSNGGALKLTIGEYFTPDGVNLAKSHGIHPDVQATDNPSTPADEALEKAWGVLAAER